MKKKIAHYLRNKIIVGVIALVLIVIVGVAFASSGNGEIGETATVTRGSVRESVEVTGKVAPFGKADLGFEKGGVLAQINAKVGDAVKKGTIIASLDNADTLASLRGAEAHLLGERARLSELQKGLRPEELSVETAKYKASQSDFTEGRTALLNALHDAYVKAETSLVSHTDVMFNNPRSARPTVVFVLDSYAEENRISQSRALVTQNLLAWKSDLDSLTLDSDPAPYALKARGYLMSIKTLMSELSVIVSDLNSGGSGFTEAQIDTYTTALNDGISALNTAVASLAAGESAYNTASSNLSIAEDQFDLQKAGSSVEALEIQMASVNKASADVLALQAELGKRRVVAPIDGILTKADAHLGEFISPGTVSFAMISEESFKVEIFVPEVDIAKISVNDVASIQLDAYGEDAVFKAHVISVDPAETVVEGVPTYKVTLQFDEKDARVRSGMTANIEIETNFKKNVLTVPYRAITQRKGESFVKVLDSDEEYTEVKVVTGLKGSDGMVEIQSGLSEGMMVVTLLK
ncbi:MAG: efflux RND transporter periplasmic adaptor subunit [Patescibacteria group bacterium]